MYTGSEEDARLSSVERHSAAVAVEGRHPSWRQFTPPDSLLLSAYRAAFAEADTRTAYVQCVTLQGKLPCASGTYSTQEAVTRSLYVQYGGPGTYV